jgi:hypothetical protein
MSKSLISGLKNSQRVRVIVNEVGFYTTVKGALDTCFRAQFLAIQQVLSHLGELQRGPKANRSTGLATRVNTFDHNDKPVSFDVQIDLI